MTNIKIQNVSIFISSYKTKKKRRRFNKMEPENVNFVGVSYSNVRIKYFLWSKSIYNNTTLHNTSDTIYFFFVSHFWLLCKFSLKPYCYKCAQRSAISWWFFLSRICLISFSIFQSCASENGFSGKSLQQTLLTFIFVSFCV